MKNYIKILLYTLSIEIIFALPLKDAEIEQNPISVKSKTEENSKFSFLVPINSGAVIGEIVVGSGAVSVQRGKPSSRRNEPSFSPLISESEVPEITLSIGSANEGDKKIRPPKKINGSTVVFNNEAAITQIA